MEKIIYRQNKMFCIDKSKLSQKALKDDIINALYAAIYTEFAGANYNDDYKNLNSLERLQKRSVNDHQHRKRKFQF